LVTHNIVAYIEDEICLERHILTKYYHVPTSQY